MAGFFFDGDAIDTDFVQTLGGPLYDPRLTPRCGNLSAKCSSAPWGAELDGVEAIAQYARELFTLLLGQCKDLVQHLNRC
jgi:hypothetical protein